MNGVKALILAVVAVCSATRGESQTKSSENNTSAPDLELIKKMSPILDLVAKQRVLASAKMNWCRWLDYPRGVFGESWVEAVDGRKIMNSRVSEKDLSGRPIQFDNQANEDWEELWALIHSVDVRFMSLSNAIIKDGRVQYVDFRLSTDLALWSLVYSPEGRSDGPELPPGSHRINAFWLVEMVADE